MANHKRKYETADEIRAARAESSRKCYKKHRDQRLAYMREYYRKRKAAAKEGDPDEKA